MARRELWDRAEWVQKPRPCDGTANGVNAAVVTGPNFSGKSVYLKQVGILVFLAMCGSFLPCDDAIIGVVDRIFTRIESVETCTVPQSTFTIDVNNVVNGNAADGYLSGATVLRDTRPPVPSCLVTTNVPSAWASMTG